MIYTRPEIQEDYNQNGMSDFICTNTVQYFVRDDKLISFVNMRSNDVVFGYRNDRAWQLHVQEMLAKDLDVEWWKEKYSIFNLKDPSSPTWINL